jgi:hypothetical protein
MSRAHPTLWRLVVFSSEERQRTAAVQTLREIRQVLDCGSPLPLSILDEHFAPAQKGRVKVGIQCLKFRRNCPELIFGVRFFHSKVTGAPKIHKWNGKCSMSNHSFGWDF